MTDGWWYNGYRVSDWWYGWQIELPRGLDAWQRYETNPEYPRGYLVYDGCVLAVWFKQITSPYPRDGKQAIHRWIDSNLEAIDPITAFSLEYGIGTASKGERS